MKRICITFSIALFSLIVISQASAAAFQSVFHFSGGFDIKGYTPVPQINGFDYYFTPVSLDSLILGQQCTIDSVEVSMFGTNLGNVVNWDLEVNLGPTSFGLPSGQFTQTHVDPVSGYSRTAPTQYHMSFGTPVDSQSYQFDTTYDFQSIQAIASPFLGQVKKALTSTYDLSQGLDAQLFFWTADNRNSQFQFGDVTLTVNGTIVPEPATLTLALIAIPKRSTGTLIASRSSLVRPINKTSSPAWPRTGRLGCKQFISLRSLQATTHAACPAP